MVDWFWIDCRVKTIDLFATHANLLRACKNIQQHILCQIQFLHVKGYQDNGHLTVLSQEAWLNIETDLIAKSCISDNIPKHLNLLLPLEPWQLIINKDKIIKHHQRAI